MINNKVVCGIFFEEKIKKVRSKNNYVFSSVFGKSKVGKGICFLIRNDLRNSVVSVNCSFTETTEFKRFIFFKRQISSVLLHPEKQLHYE